MKSPASIYTHCDELEKLPEKHRLNWLYEFDRLCDLLPKGATVLQVGSMDGSRILRFLKKRPDLRITGLEIDRELADVSRENIEASAMNAEIVTGDITAPPPTLKKYQHVLCLNHTLGYIPDQESALRNMRKLGDSVIVSVYGEKFTDALAHEYFSALGLEIDEIVPDLIKFKDFTSVKRYTRNDIEAWNGRIEETPLGYLCIL